VTERFIYIAGKMQGLPNFGFDLFDEARDYVNEYTDFTAISPADLDREMGFSPTTPPEKVTPHFIADCMQRDFEAILKSVGIMLLDNWTLSKGANRELSVARWTGKEVFTAEYLVTTQLVQSEPKYTKYTTFTDLTKRLVDTFKLDGPSTPVMQEVKTIVGMTLNPTIMPNLITELQPEGPSVVDSVRMYTKDGTWIAPEPAAEDNGFAYEEVPV
jgi:Domain of unknown function (DUF4406)